MISTHLELDGITEWSVPDDLEFHAFGETHFEKPLTLLAGQIKSNNTATAANGNAAERIHCWDAHAAMRSTCTWVLNSRPMATRIP